MKCFKSFLLLVFVLAFCGQAWAVDYSQDANCQGAWLFNDNLTDSSGKGNDLTAVGTSAYETGIPSGHTIGKAIHLDGTTGYLTRTDANLSAAFPVKNGTTNTAYSVSYWFKRDTTPTANSFIMTKSQYIDCAGGFTSTGSYIDLYFRFTDTGAQAFETTHDTNTSNATWYHVVMTYSGASPSGTITLYISSESAFGDKANGTAITATNVDNITGNTWPFNLGAGYDGNNKLDGLIYEPAVFNKVLSAAEALDIYTNGLTGGGGEPPPPPPPPSGLHTYYVKSGGNDSSAGTADETAWANCPGMSGWTGSVSLVPGDVVYFRSQDTWTKTGSGNQVLLLTAGVKYYGDVYGSGTRAKFLFTGSSDQAKVWFGTSDNATESTVFEGFEVDGGSTGGTLVAISYYMNQNKTGAVKRVKNCVVHDNDPGTTGVWDYGILAATSGAYSVSNVEVIGCTVYNTGESGIIAYRVTGGSGSVSNVLFKGNTVYSCGLDQGPTGHGTGLQFRQKTINSTMEDNVAYSNSYAGIQISGTDADAIQTGNVIRYNKIYNNTSSGIRLTETSAKTVAIYGNVFYSNYVGILGDGDFTSTSNSVSIFNNSFYNDVPYSIQIGSAANGTFSVRNNAFHQVSGLAIYDIGTEIDTHTNNLYYKASGNVVTSGGSSYTSATVVAGYEATAQVTDPLFTTPASGDFILGVGSPAIDAGADLGTYNLLGAATSWPSSIVLVDADSNTWDIGAYTYTASGGETDAPVITVVSGTDAGPTQTDTINLTIADASAITQSKYGYSADNTCNASDTYSTTYTTGVNFSITGNHVDYLCAMAQDVYGNTGYQLVGQLNTDNTAPVVNITSPTSGTVDGTGVITFTDNDTTDPECALDSGAYTNCTSETTVINTLTGWGDIAAGAAFTLRLRDTDTAGNVGSTSVSLTRSGGAAGDIAACGTIATSGGSHLVSENLTNAGGTCLIISGSNNSIDLGGYKITAGTAAAGVGITITGNNNKVYNGSIAVGGGTQVNVAGVYLSGTGNEIYYLDIETSGGAISGEQYVNSVHIANAPNKVHHIWGKVSGTTTNISYAPDNIWYTARNSGGAEIHDCVLVGGHRGINADLVGYNVVEAGGTPPTSRIYNNYVQHLRTPGCKQPNGIGVTMASRFEVYNNQIISDDGRGFITSCYGNGNPTGTSYVNFNSNRVDVAYFLEAIGGGYPENHVTGTYSRYSTFNSTLNDNIVIVQNPAGDATECFFNGSDSDDLQGNNTYARNICINHDTGTDAPAFRLAVFDSLYITDNTYLAPAGLWIGNWDYYNSGGVPPVVSGNTIITPTSYTPSAPTGLALRKFSTDCYLLTWNDNRTTYPDETQTYEYYIYKDDVKVAGITSRGGTFYVDLDEGDATDYKITAVNLYGTEGTACDNVNTSTATAGWTGAATDTTPPVISSLLPTGTLACPADPYYQDISWSTNEAATCKFSTSDIAYDSMESLAQVTGGVTHHSSQVYTTCGRDYTYYVRCIDETGNRNTSSYTIAFTLSALNSDVTAPVCTITTPADDPHASVAATVTIEGSASDAVGVTSVTWVNDQGGSGTATGTTSWSFTAALTTSGNNTFTVSANDAAGNAGTDTVVVTYAVPPTIVIASPAAGTYTASDFTITISGVCDDDSAVTAVSWANDLGGSDTCTTDGTTFSCVVQLFRGVNTVTVTAADDDEPANESTDELVVTYLTSIFYINDGTGSDTYSGTSPDNPWETVDQLNASTFDPGDQVLLRRGRTFTGKIVMPSSGTEGSPIILGAYGTGEDPVIDCSGETNCIDADSQTYITVGNIHMINSTGARITGHDATWTIAANSYYLDATSGSNSNVGSESLPYETVAYVESLVWMIPGDIVYLKKGETFTGPLIIPASGDSDKYIYVKAYGSGDRPVIQ